MKILVTGSSGLIGRHLCAVLRERGYEVVTFDLKSQGENAPHDVTNAAAVDAVIEGVDGVVNLAAVSRVVHGQKDPSRCIRTNVGGLSNIVSAAIKQKVPPWILFSSSREVYGETRGERINESAELRPVNVYAQSKLIGENLIKSARLARVNAQVVRFSNVYGDTLDHYDRVVPAFTRAAALSGRLQVEDGKRVFDFVHVDDAVRGAMAVIEVMCAGRALPPAIHFVSGRSTSLMELARMCVSLAGTEAEIVETSGRTYDVTGFVGDPSLAREVLSWQTEIGLEQGLGDMIRDWQKALLDHGQESPV
jgi:nucleoside-diphosphate-sugar epimerase